MILVDIPRGDKSSANYKNQASLRTYIRSLNIECEHNPLQWGDACFDGNGPDGNMTIGIERKALHDMLNTIDTSNYAGKQRIGMKQMYRVSFLFVEGFWKAREDGMLMESKNGCDWFLCRPNGRTVMYSKLRRYLYSMTYSGVIVNFTQTVFHTALDIVECYHYHQKKWADHTSLREIPKLAIPQMNFTASLVRKWASDIDGVGVKLSEDAERLFRKPIVLAQADEADWLRIPGIGIAKAQDIVRKIHGY
jgi:ERCC4-type nuclease